MRGSVRGDRRKPAPYRDICLGMCHVQPSLLIGIPGSDTVLLERFALFLALDVLSNCFAHYQRGDLSSASARTSTRLWMPASSLTATGDGTAFFLRWYHFILPLRLGHFQTLFGCARRTGEIPDRKRDFLEWAAHSRYTGRPMIKLRKEDLPHITSRFTTRIVLACSCGKHIALLSAPQGVGLAHYCRQVGGSE